MQLIEADEAEAVVQETRLWDETKQVTMSMRKKEGLADYRYFPEPDLPPLEVNEAYLQDVQVLTCSPAACALTTTAPSTSACASQALCHASVSIMPNRFTQVTSGATVYLIVAASMLSFIVADTQTWSNLLLKHQCCPSVTLHTTWADEVMALLL